MARREDKMKLGRESREGDMRQDKVRGSMTPDSGLSEDRPMDSSHEDIRGGSTSESRRPPREHGRLPLPD